MRRYLFPALLGLALTAPVLAQETPEDFAKINEAISTLDDEKKVDEAAALAERTLPLIESKLGSGHAETARLLNLYARMRQQQGREKEAEALFLRAIAIREKVLGADHPLTAQALNNLAIMINRQGREPEALPLFERVLAIRAKERGAEHASLGMTHVNLGTIKWKLKRYAEAEAHLKQALAINEKALGPDHADIAYDLVDLARLYGETGRKPEALPLMRRATDLRRKALGTDDLAMRTTAELARLLFDLGQPGEAIPLQRDVLTYREQTKGPSSPEAGRALIGLADSLRETGRWDETERHYRRALAIFEKAEGEKGAGTATALNRLGILLGERGKNRDAKNVLARSLAIVRTDGKPADVVNAINSLAVVVSRLGETEEADRLNAEALEVAERGMPQSGELAVLLSNSAAHAAAAGRFAEAERLYKRALAINAALYPEGHPDEATALSNFATLLSDQGRAAEAEALFKRALTLREAHLGATHHLTATSRNNLAAHLGRLGRLKEAEALYAEALRATEAAFGQSSPQAAQIMSNLAGVKDDGKDREGAEALYRSALAIITASPDASGADKARAINNLAVLLAKTGRAEESAKLFGEALVLYEAALGGEHPSTTSTRANLGRVLLALGRDAQAVVHLERATASLARERARLNTAEAGALTGKSSEALRLGEGPFGALVQAYHRLGGGQVEKAFIAAQAAAQTEAGAALQQMALRQALADPAMSLLIRERQDIVSEWQGLDKALLIAVSAGSAARDANLEAEMTARKEAIDARLAAIDDITARENPGYATLAAPAPLTVSEVQAALKPNEVMLYYFESWQLEPVPSEVFLFAIPKTGEPRMVKVKPTPKQLAAATRNMRALLGVGGPSRGASEVLEEGEEESPFDLDYGYRLYEALIAPVSEMTAGKALVLVQSESLASIPFQLLVTEPPRKGMDYADVPWLVRDHAMTVLPAVFALAALRRDAKPSAAPDAYLGIGNPLLVGDDGADRRAFALDGCGAAKLAETAEPPKRSGADVEDVRRLAPLPETLAELCAVAAAMGAGETAIHAGDAAREPAIKALPLDQARILHFATHGLMAGELAGLAEPAIVLSPPEHTTPDDDGLLKASEVAALKLDAEWVILSACNTAAGEGGNAEAFSGLARAFFYAGARSLMVSHWPVNSKAAVELTTGAIGELAAHPEIGRAEALRRAMLKLIAEGGRKAHPAYWAPFVVAGEGG